MLQLLAFLPFFAVAGENGISHSACEPFAQLPASVYRFTADLDGVNGPEQFVADRTGESTIISACDDAALGPWDMGDTNKPLNTVVVVDVEGDGIDELIIGGTTGSSPLAGHIARLVGSGLESGESISVRPASDLISGETFACLDTGDVDLRELVNYSYSTSADSSEIHWNGSDDSEGVFKLPSQATEAWLFRSAQCGQRIVVNLELLINGYPQEVALGALASRLADDKFVQFGVNNNILFQKTPEQLTEVSDWVIRLEQVAGYEGPFSLLSLLEKAEKLTVGAHDHCAGQALEPPKLSEENLIQISAQPSQINSCLQWFSVDLWMRRDFTIAAVVLNIWEP